MKNASIKKAILLYVIYLFLSSILFILLFPFLWIYTKITNKEKFFFQRIGFHSRFQKLKNYSSPTIWIHAVSVGEVGVARSLINAIEELSPQKITFILSTTTSKGHEFALQSLGDKAICIYAPFDFILSIFNSLKFFKPNFLVILETEIWPTWIVMAHKMKIKTAIINGRISEKSFQRYKKIYPLISWLLEKIHVFSMIDNENGNRLNSLGIGYNKIHINSNAKFDLYLSQIKPLKQQHIQSKIKKILKINDMNKVFVAGSTRTGEEEIILESFLKCCDSSILLIIAPRHVERVPQIINYFNSKKISYSLFSNCKKNGRDIKNNIVLVDTIGDLMSIYSIASLVFCGASLVPLGGQNILEPAAWGKPVMYGPYMDDFLEAKTFLENKKACIPLKNKKELFEKTKYYLNNINEAKEIGIRAKKALELKAGSAKKHAEIIMIPYRLQDKNFGRSEGAIKKRLATDLYKI